MKEAVLPGFLVGEIIFLLTDFLIFNSAGYHEADMTGLAREEGLKEGDYEREKPPLMIKRH